MGDIVEFPQKMKPKEAIPLDGDYGVLISNIPIIVRLPKDFDPSIETRGIIKKCDSLEDATRLSNTILKIMVGYVGVSQSGKIGIDAIVTFDGGKKQCKFFEELIHLNMPNGEE